MLTGLWVGVLFPWGILLEGMVASMSNGLKKKCWIVSFLLSWLLAGAAYAACGDSGLNVFGTMTREGSSTYAGALVAFLSEDGGETFSYTTNDAGCFEADLAAGTYRIRMQFSDASPLWLIENQWHDREVVGDEALASSFDVVAGYDPFQNYSVVVPLVSLSGRIELNGPTSGGTTLRFLPVGGGTAVVPNGETDAEGNFWMDLQPGTYTIEIQPGGATSVWLSQGEDGTFSSVETVEDATPFVIDEQSLQFFEVSVEVAPIAVSGTVGLAGMTEHAGTHLFFWPYDAVGMFPVAGAEAYTTDQATGADGSFSVELVPGSYRIEIQGRGSSSIWLGPEVSGELTVVSDQDQAAAYLLSVDANRTFDVTITSAPVILSGSVTLAGDTATQAGTHVTFLAAEGSSDVTPVSATTDAEGGFEVSLSPGTYTIRLQPRGFSPVWLDRSENGFPTVTREMSRAFAFMFGSDAFANPILDVQIDSLTASGTVTLAGTASNEGTVVTFTPDGVEHAEVRTVSTDGSGSFSLELWPGSYLVSMAPALSTEVWLGPEVAGVRTHVAQAAQAVPVEINATVMPPLDAELTVAPVAVTGTVALTGVADSTGTDLFFFPDGETTPIAFVDATDARGAFAVSLPSDSYTVQVQPARAASFWLGQDPDTQAVTILDETQEPARFSINAASDYVFQLRLAVPTVSVSGSIMTAMTTHDGTVLRFYPADSTESLSPEEPTNASGEFSLDVPPGLYRVEIQPDGFAALWFGYDTPDGARTVVTDEGDAAVFDIHAGQDADTFFSTFLPSVSVSGTIRLRGAVSDAGTTVQVWPSVVRFWAVDRRGDPIRTADNPTDEQGAFLVDHLLPGSYIIEVQPQGSTSVWLQQDDAGAVTTTEEIQEASSFFLDGTSSPTFDVTIVLRPVMVSGTVALTGVTAQEGTRVRFFLNGEDEASPPEAISDETGAFSLPLGTGSYAIEVWPQGSAPLYVSREVDSDALTTIAHDQQPPLFSISALDPSVFDVTVAVAPLVVTGTLMMHDVAQAGTTLLFRPVAADGGVEVSQTTDEEGNFSVGVLPGSYTVGVQEEGGSQLWLTRDTAGRLTVVGDAAYATPFLFDYNEEAHPSIHVDVQPVEVTGTVALLGADHWGATVVQFVPVAASVAESVVANTDDNGDFDLAVPMGRYTVALQLPDARALWVHRRADGTLTAVEEVAQASVFTMDTHSHRAFRVTLPALPVMGTVHLPGATAQAGTIVRFWPAGVEMVDGAAIERVTEASGAFSGALAPGSYRVEIQPEGGASVWLGADEGFSVEALPVLTGNNSRVRLGGRVTLDRLVSVVDNAAVVAGYRVWDEEGQGTLSDDTGVLTAGAWVTLATTDLSTVTYTADPEVVGRASLWVQALDGQGDPLGASAEIMLSTVSEVVVPEVAARQVQVPVGGTVTLDAFVTVTSRYAIADYQVWDYDATHDGSNDGALYGTSGPLETGTWVTVGTTDLSTLSYAAGDVVGQESLWLRPLDEQGEPIGADLIIVVSTTEAVVPARTLVRRASKAFAFPVASGVNQTFDVVVDAAYRDGLVTVGGQIQRDGDVVSGARVRIRSATATRLASFEGITDGQGAYTVMVPEDLYHVEIQLPDQGAVFVGLDEETLRPNVVRSREGAYPFVVGAARGWTNISVDVASEELPVLIDLAGSVTEDGQHIEGVAVRLSVVSGEGVRAVETVTDRFGQYALRVPVGGYRMEIQLPDKAPVVVGVDGDDNLVVSRQWDDAFTFSLNGVDWQRIDLNIAERDTVPWVVFSGTIRQEQRGTGLAGMRLSVWPEGGSAPLPVQIVSDAVGRYTGWVRPGTYQIELRGPGTGSAFLAVDDTIPQWPVNRLVAARAEASWYVMQEDVDIDMLVQAGVLQPLVGVHGQITTQDAGDTQAVAGAMVSFHPVGREGVPPIEMMTDAQGGYDLNLPRGAYTVEVTPLGDGALHVGDDGHLAATPQVLTLDADRTLDLAYDNTDIQTLLVQGTITDDQGRAVVGVRVTMQPQGDADDTAPGSLVEGITTADGRFVVRVVAGSYHVVLQTRYTEGGQEVVATDASGQPVALLDGFASGVGGVVSDRGAAQLYALDADTTLDIQMTAGVPLSGYVRRSVGGDSDVTAGLPVEGAQVSIYRPGMRDRVHAQTDETGFFSVRVEPNQNYAVEAWPEACEAQAAACLAERARFVGGALVVTQADAVVERTAQNVPVVTASHPLDGDGTLYGAIVTTEDATQITQFTMDHALELTLVVDTGQMVTGRVVNEAGEGVGHAWVDNGLGGVQSMPEDGGFTLLIPSSVDGASTFSLSVWPERCDSQATAASSCRSNTFIGGYVVSRDGGFVLSSEAADGTLFRADGSDWPAVGTGMDVTVHVGQTITGQVTHGGHGVANIWVEAWSSQMAVGGGVFTDDGGRFSLNVAPPAGDETVTYEVGVWTDQYVVPDPILVSVGGDSVSPVVNFSLVEGRRVRGRVVDAEGDGLPGIWVDIHDRQASRFFGATTDETGLYSVRVEEGHYVAVIWGDGDQRRTTWYPQVRDEVHATVLDLSRTNQDNIDFQLGAGARIRGTLTAGTAGTISLHVWSERTHSWGGTEVTLDAGGTTAFSIGGLQEAEDYRLAWVAEGYMDGYYGGPASGPVGHRQAYRLDTRAGDVEGVAIALQAGNTLTLTVAGMSADEVVEADVWSDTVHRGGWATGSADSDGEVVLEINNLDATVNDYRVFVRALSGLYVAGNYRAPATGEGAGSLVGWEHATRIDMAESRALHVRMGRGGVVSGAVRGLEAGQVAWVTAFSEATHGWGETMVVGGADGSADYTVTGLKQARDYRVGVHGEGVMRGYHAGPGQAYLVPWADAFWVDIRTDEAAGIDLPVASGVTISGTVGGVYGRDGLQRGEWAWIDAWSDATGSWGGVLVAADDHSEEEGATVSYTLTGMASASDYHLQLDAEGYVPQRRQGVDATESVTGVDFTLLTGGSMTGTIQGVEGSQWVWVEAFSPSTGARGETGVWVDETGSSHYTLRGLASAEDYAVTLRLDGHRFFYAIDGVSALWSAHSGVAVPSSGATEGIDFMMQAVGHEVYDLSGQVTLSPANEDQVVDVRAWSAQGVTARVSRTGSGTFVLSGLPAGAYTVEVASEGYVAQHTGRVDAQPWTSRWDDLGQIVLAADRADLDVTLNRGVTLRGTVSRTVGAVTEVVSGVWVNARDAATGYGAGAFTRADGHYEMVGLPDGSYHVEVWTPAGSATQSIALSLDADVDNRVDLTIAQPLGGGVRGTVESASGEAQGGVLVLLFDGTEQISMTATDTEGNFELAGLRAASYTLKLFGDAALSSAHAYLEQGLDVVDEVVEIGTLTLSTAAIP